MVHFLMFQLLIAWVGLMIGIYDLIFAYGAHYKRLGLIIFCQIFLTIYILCLFGLAFVAVPIFIMKHLDSVSEVAAFLILIFVIIFLCLYYIYMWIIINSLRKEIGREAEVVYPDVEHVLPDSASM
jgi:hypothetical protein